MRNAVIFLNMLLLLASITKTAIAQPKQVPQPQRRDISTAPGQTYEYSPKTLPEGIATSKFTLWLPDSIKSGQPVRGILGVSHYERGGALFENKQYRELAEKLNFAVLRYGMMKQTAEYKLCNDERAVQLLNAALADFAKQTNRPEVEHAGIVLTGLSQAGWQACKLAAVMPDRVIAAVPFHEATPVHENELAGNVAGHSVPQLHVMGGKCFLTPYIQPWVLQARRKGALWATCLQPMDSHADVGDLTFPIAWIETVANQRVPKTIPVGKSYSLQPLKESAGQLVILELKVSGNFTPYEQLAAGPGGRGTERGKQVTAPKMTIVERALLNTADKPAESLWLPNPEIAKQWVEYHGTNVKRRPPQ